MSTVWDLSSDVHSLANFDLLSSHHGYIHRGRIKIQQWVEYILIVTAVVALIFVQTSTDKLSSLVVHGSFHNSGERFDAPMCSEDTRVAIVNDILSWFDDIAGPFPVLWMNGAAGAGKTAIAQTIAKLLYEQGRLAASFFYSRTAADSDRRNDFKVIPTLVYQLMRNIPESGEHISAALANDEFLFDLTVGTQLERLIVAPILLCSNAMSASGSPKIIIIDGLDGERCKLQHIRGSRRPSYFAHVFGRSDMDIVLCRQLYEFSEVFFQHTISQKTNFS